MHFLDIMKKSRWMHAFGSILSQQISMFICAKNSNSRFYLPFTSCQLKTYTHTNNLSHIQQNVSYYVIKMFNTINTSIFSCYIWGFNMNSVFMHFYRVFILFWWTIFDVCADKKNWWAWKFDKIDLDFFFMLV